MSYPSTGLYRSPTAAALSHHLFGVYSAPVVVAPQCSDGEVERFVQGFGFLVSDAHLEDEFLRPSPFSAPQHRREQVPTDAPSLMVGADRQGVDGGARAPHFEKTVPGETAVDFGDEHHHPATRPGLLVLRKIPRSFLVEQRGFKVDNGRQVPLPHRADAHACLGHAGKRCTNPASTHCRPTHPGAGFAPPSCRRASHFAAFIARFAPSVSVMNNTIITIFSTFGTVCGLLLVIPQITKTLRTKNAAGVSLGGLIASFVSWFAWVPYTLSTGDLRGTFGLVIPGAIQGVAVFVAWRHGADRTSLSAAPLMVLLVGGAFLLGGWPLHMLALGTTTLWAYLPALVSAARAADISGISLGAWRVSTVYGVCWFVFGLLTGANGFVYTGSMNFLLSAAMLVVVALRSRTRTTQVLYVPAASPVRVVASADRVSVLSN